MPGLTRQGDFHAGHAQSVPPYYHSGALISTTPTVTADTRPIIVSGDYAADGAQAEMGYFPTVRAGANRSIHHQFAPVREHHTNTPVGGLHPTVSVQGSLSVTVGSTMAAIVGGLMDLALPLSAAGAVVSPVLNESGSPKEAGLPTASDIAEGYATEIGNGIEPGLNDALEYGDGALVSLGVVASGSLLAQSPLFSNKPERVYKAGRIAGTGAKFNVGIYQKDVVDENGQVKDVRHYFQVFREEDTTVRRGLADAEEQHKRRQKAREDEIDRLQDAGETNLPDKIGAFDVDAVDRSPYRFWSQNIADPLPTTAFPVSGHDAVNPANNNRGYERGDILVVPYTEFAWPEEGKRHSLVIEVLNVEKAIAGDYTLGVVGTTSVIEYTLAARGRGYAIQDIVRISGARLTISHTGAGGTGFYDVGDVYFEVVEVGEDGVAVFKQAHAEPFTYVPPNKVAPAAASGGEGAGDGDNTPEPGEITGITVSDMGTNISVTGRIFRVEWEGNPYPPIKYRRKKDVDGEDIVLAAGSETVLPDERGIYQIRDLASGTDVENWRRIGMPAELEQAYKDLIFTLPENEAGSEERLFSAGDYGEGTVLVEMESAAAVQQLYLELDPNNSGDAKAIAELRDRGFEDISKERLQAAGGAELEDGVIAFFRPVFAFPGVEPMEDVGGDGAGDIERTGSGLRMEAHVDNRVGQEIMSLAVRVVERYRELKGDRGLVLSVVSAYRGEVFNRVVAGAPESPHKEGRALDILVAKGLDRVQRDFELFVRACVDVGVPGIGIMYEKGFVHIDDMEKRAWGHDGSRNSLPSWSRGILEAGGYAVDEIA